MKFLPRNVSVVSSCLATLLAFLTHDSHAQDKLEFKIWLNGLPAGAVVLDAEKVKQLHAYSKGGHGYGIRESDNPVSKWHHNLEPWLKVSGFLEPPEGQ